MFVFRILLPNPKYFTTFAVAKRKIHHYELSWKSRLADYGRTAHSRHVLDSRTTDVHHHHRYPLRRATLQDWHISTVALRTRLYAQEQRYQLLAGGFQCPLDTPRLVGDRAHALGIRFDSLLHHRGHPMGRTTLQIGNSIRLPIWKGSAVNDGVLPIYEEDTVERYFCANEQIGIMV